MSRQAGAVQLLIRVEEKFDYYDVIGTLVPGVFVLAGFWCLFEWSNMTVHLPEAGDALSVVIFLALSFFFGALVQGLGGLAEPLFDRTWGGKPSESIWSGGDSVLRSTAIERIRASIVNAMHGSSTPEKVPTNQDLFQFAKAICVRHDLGRVNRFNALYAYHRNCLAGTLVLLAVDVALAVYSCCNAGPVRDFIWAGVMLLPISVLLWWRTKRRAYSYVREVLQMAEQASAADG